MHLWPLLIGVLGIVVVGRALVIAIASVDGQGLLREEEPRLYWSVVLIAILVSGFRFYQAFAS